MLKPRPTDVVRVRGSLQVFKQFPSLKNIHVGKLALVQTYFILDKAIKNM